MSRRHTFIVGLIIYVFVFCKPSKQNISKIENFNKVPQVGTIKFVATKSGVRLRSSPSVKSASLALISYDKAVFVIPEKAEIIKIQGQTGMWLKGIFEEKEGYVFSGFLSDFSQNKTYSPQKQYYFARSGSSKAPCLSTEAYKCEVFVAFKASGERLIELGSEKPEKWTSEEEIYYESHGADGGGYGQSEAKVNILDGKKIQIHSWGGNFDHDSEGYHDQYHCILTNCIIFRFDSKANELGIYEDKQPSNGEIVGGRKIAKIQNTSSKKMAFHSASGLLDVDVKKSMDAKDMIHFRFNSTDYSIKFPELTLNGP